MKASAAKSTGSTFAGTEPGCKLRANEVTNSAELS